MFIKLIIPRNSLALYQKVNKHIDYVYNQKRSVKDKTFEDQQDPNIPYHNEGLTYQL